MLALKCSSWTSINQGTSGRAFCGSIGADWFKSVLEANCLIERRPCSTCLDFFGYRMKYLLYSEKFPILHGFPPFLVVCQFYPHSLGDASGNYIYIGPFACTYIPLGLGTPSSRTICLIIVITALGGSWVLEQPGLSAAEYYPWFRDILTALYESQLGSAVSEPLL